MGLISQVECTNLTHVEEGGIHFFTPQSSNETVLVEIPPYTIDELFCHQFQTDQLFVVRGSVVLAYLQNHQYDYILMTQAFPLLVKIPPGIPHAAINLGPEACWVVNALIRHGPPFARDYQPIKRPFPYDLARVQKLFDDAAQPSYYGAAA